MREFGLQNNEQERQEPYAEESAA